MIESQKLRLKVVRARGIMSCDSRLAFNESSLMARKNTAGRSYMPLKGREVSQPCIDPLVLVNQPQEGDVLSDLSSSSSSSGVARRLVSPYPPPEVTLAQPKRGRGRPRKSSKLKLSVKRPKRGDKTTLNTKSSAKTIVDEVKCKAKVFLLSQC